LHPDLPEKMRKWVGPIGFYVTAVRDRAIDYAKQHAHTKQKDAAVLSWDAARLGLGNVLLSLKDPTNADIDMARDLGLSGIRGPGLWGILVFEPKAIPGNREKAKKSEALEKKLPYSSLPLTAPTHGASPRFDVQPIPDYQFIYTQPESDERNKLEREHQETRRAATAYRNRGVFSFHGDMRMKPELKYVAVKTAHPQHNPDQPASRSPTMRSPKLIARLEAGSTRQGSTYEDSERDDEDVKKRPQSTTRRKTDIKGGKRKRKKRTKLVVRR